MRIWILMTLKLIKTTTVDNIHNYNCLLTLYILNKTVGTPTVDTSNTVFEDFTVNVDGITDNDKKEEVEIKKVNPVTTRKRLLLVIESETEEEGRTLTYQTPVEEKGLNEDTGVGLQ